MSPPQVYNQIYAFHNKVKCTGNKKYSKFCHYNILKQNSPPKIEISTINHRNASIILSHKREGIVSFVAHNPKIAKKTPQPKSPIPVISLIISISNFFPLYILLHRHSTYILLLHCQNPRYKSFFLAKSLQIAV